MENVKSQKTLNFDANVCLSRNQADGDIVCELPVMKEGKPVFPCVLLIIGNICCMYSLFCRCLNLLLNDWRLFFLLLKFLFYSLRSDLFSVTTLVTGGYGIKHISK